MEDKTCVWFPKPFCILLPKLIKIRPCNSELLAYFLGHSVYY